MAGRRALPQHGRLLPASPIICLVDDDPSVLRSLGGLLTYEGFAVLMFRDPTDFIKHAASHPVTLDCLMPGLSGMQVQACLRTLSPDTRVIMMSAVCDRDLRHMVMAAPVEDAEADRRDVERRRVAPLLQAFPQQHLFHSGAAHWLNTTATTQEPLHLHPAPGTQDRRPTTIP